MHVLNVSQLTLVSESDSLEVEVQDLSLPDLRNENKLSEIFELVVWLKVEKSEVH